jgi:hypothetical protein
MLKVRTFICLTYSVCDFTQSRSFRSGLLDVVTGQASFLGRTSVGGLVRSGIVAGRKNSSRLRHFQKISFNSNLFFDSVSFQDLLTCESKHK